MQWQDIIRQDAYLAGNLAAGSYEWWEETAPSAAATAVHCGLTEGEEAYADFLRGWNDRLSQLEIDHLKQLHAELEKAGENYTKGDPELF